MEPSPRHPAAANAAIDQRRTRRSRHPRHPRPMAGDGAGPWMLAGAFVTLEDLIRLRVHAAATPSAPIVTRHHGTRTSPIRGRGMDFDEVRPYQPGDDVRAIDWRVTARKGKPHTKVFREERERPTLIVVDQTRSMFFGSRRRLKSVLAAEVAARTAWRALAAQDRVGGLVLDDRDARVFKPLRRETAVLRLLAAVVRANRALGPGPPAADHGAPAAETDGRGGDAWWRLVPPLLRLARGNHRIVVVSDFLGGPESPSSDDRSALDALAGIARHNEVELHFVLDPLERALPPAGRYRVSDGTRRHAFDSGDPGLRAAYAAHFAARRDLVEDAASRAGMRFMLVSTDADGR